MSASASLGLASNGAEDSHASIALQLSLPGSRFPATANLPLNSFAAIRAGFMRDGEPKTCIPALAREVKASAAIGGYAPYELADRLRRCGWQGCADSMPAEREELVGQRIINRHGVRHDPDQPLPDDRSQALAWGQKHQTTWPMAASEATSFNQHQKPRPGATNRQAFIYREERS